MSVTRHNDFIIIRRPEGISTTYFGSIATKVLLHAGEDVDMLRTNPNYTVGKEYIFHPDEGPATSKKKPFMTTRFRLGPPIDATSPEPGDVVVVIEGPEGPEATGVYACECGNRELFTGIDSHGFAGPEECTMAEGCTEEECAEDTELRQNFSVREDGELVYEGFTGGGADATIGSYTSIICRPCGAFIYREPERTL